MKFVNGNKKTIMIRVKERIGTRWISVGHDEKVELPKEVGEKYGLKALEGEDTSKKAKSDKKSVEDKKDKKGKYSKTDLKDADKTEQVKILKELGVSDKDIQKLTTEKKRVDKILELQNAKNNK